MNQSKITIPSPSFNSDLVNILFDLEKLRSKKLYGNVPPHIFFQLKEVFHILETLGSARIEGNNTTLAEYVEKILEKNEKVEESQKEIQNINEAIHFIEENIEPDTSITRALISEIHKIVTKDLTPPPKGEGSRYPGELRKENVSIQSSSHKTPDVAVLSEFFNSFIDFVNTPQIEQFQLLQVAVTHHRFAYIHMFDNGNGRMGRLLDYMFLIKLGFQVKKGRILNPSAVFYSNRERYYEMLGKADSLNDENVLSWCEYFLLGIKNEVEKIDHLLDRNYVQQKILLPSIIFAKEREYVTDLEYKILELIIKSENMEIQSRELEQFGIKDSVSKSRLMNKLKEKGFVRSIKPNGRIYTINFIGNYLLRGLIKSLEKEGFVSDFLNTN